MEFKFIIGVDISKEWFNYCLMSRQLEIIEEGKIKNTPDAIFNFITSILQRKEIASIKDLLLVMEHTGLYINHLAKAWVSKMGYVSVVHAPKVSEGLGGARGLEEKTDQLDARRLSEYGFRFGDKLELWQAKTHTLNQLQVWQRQRDRLKKALNMLEVPVKESVEFESVSIGESIIENQLASIASLKSDLKKIEEKLVDLIENDEILCQLFQLICSVPGVGPVTAREVIIATEAFSKFEPNEAKSFAKYAGIVPRKKRSGKMKKKDRIPQRCHKKIKEFLTMGARSLIKSDNELGHFYHRKMAEGKHHLAVINAIRNKLVLRIFAVVRNQVMYNKNLNLIIN